MRGGGNDETVSTGCGPPSVLHPGCYCYICKRQFCGFPGWAFCPLEVGGPDILAPGLHSSLSCSHWCYWEPHRIIWRIMLLTKGFLAVVFIMFRMGLGIFHLPRFCFKQTSKCLPLWFRHCDCDFFSHVCYLLLLNDLFSLAISQWDDIVVDLII